MEPRSPETIGQRLRRLRKERGLSLAALSNITGVPNPVISRYETGVRAAGHMRIDMAVRLADALDVPLVYLVKGIPETNEVR